MEAAETFLQTVSSWVWGPPMLILLMGTHLFLTVRLRVIQRYISLPVVWSLADIANALMAVPNLIALLALSGVIVAETRQHLWEDHE